MRSTVRSTKLPKYVTNLQGCRIFLNVYYLDFRGWWRGCTRNHNCRLWYPVKEVISPWSVVIDAICRWLTRVLCQGSPPHTSLVVICNNGRLTLHTQKYLVPICFRNAPENLVDEEITRSVFFDITQSILKDDKLLYARKKCIQERSLSIPPTSISRNISCPISRTRRLRWPVTTPCTTISPVKAHYKTNLSSHMTDNH